VCSKGENLIFSEISPSVFALSLSTNRRCNTSHDNAYIAKRQALKTCCHVSPIVRGSKVTVSKRWPSQFSGSSAHKGLNDARAQAQRVCSPAPAGQRAQAQRHSPITATPAEDTGQDVAAAKERISSPTSPVARRQTEATPTKRIGSGLAIVRCALLLQATAERQWHREPAAKKAGCTEQQSSQTPRGLAAGSERASMLAAHLRHQWPQGCLTS